MQTYQIIAIVTGAITITGFIITATASIIMMVNGLKAMMRSELLRIYYDCKLDKMHDFEYQNFLMLYDAYKKLGGNSFIELCKIEMDEWANDAERGNKYFKL